MLLHGGNVERGRQHFIDTPGGKSCTICHNVGDASNWESFDAAREPDGKGVGFPNLGDIGNQYAKDPLYLARAIFAPDAEIAPGFTKPSVMPVGYGHDLKPAEARDLLAFLQSCKRSVSLPKQ